MQINSKRIITGLVVIFELLSLYYVYPEIDTTRAFSFESTLSKVCINSRNLFEVNKRSKIFSYRTWGMDERKVMYYADLAPRPNRKYLIYFEPLPFELSKYYHFTVEEDVRVYLIKGLTWDKFKQMFDFIIRDYHKGNEPYIVSRD